MHCSRRFSANSPLRSHQALPRYPGPSGMSLQHDNSEQRADPRAYGAPGPRRTAPAAKASSHTWERPLGC